MNLPSLAWQSVYSLLAWSMVLTAVLVGLMSLWRKPSRRALLGIGAAVLVTSCAPGEWSPAHWLRLVFQLPSGFFTACCGLTLWARWNGHPGYRALPMPLAAGLVVIGTVLYLDSSAWLSLDLYARGFGPGAALVGVSIAVISVLAIAKRVRSCTAVAALLAMTAFALLRLPTGNLWDATLDPLLWLWAWLSLAARALAPSTAATVTEKTAS